MTALGTSAETSKWGRRLLDADQPKCRGLEADVVSMRHKRPTATRTIAQQTKGTRP